MPVFCSNLYIVKLIKFYLVLTLSKEKFSYSGVDLFTVSLVLEDNSKIANLHLEVCNTERVNLWPRGASGRRRLHRAPGRGESG